mgnify:CR=1 FL=1
MKKQKRIEDSNRKTNRKWKKMDKFYSLLMVGRNQHTKHTKSHQMSRFIPYNFCVFLLFFVEMFFF